MKSNMTFEQCNQVSALSEQLIIENRKIEKKAEDEIKSILNTFENNTMVLSLSGDYDEDLIATMPNSRGELDFLGVTKIKLDGTHIRVTLEDNTEWNIWEIGVNPTTILSYMADELLMEYENI